MGRRTPASAGNTPGAVANLSEQVNMTQTTRACLDCSADIGSRHGNARRCEPCSLEHQGKQNSRNPDESANCFGRNDSEACRPGRLRRLRCGKHYRRAVKAGIDLTPAQRECLACGATFQPNREDAVHCSRRCTTATSDQRNHTDNPPRACEECGSLFVPKRSDKITCSQECRGRRNYKYAIKGERDFICAHCSAVFRASRDDALFCSERCNKQAYYNANRERLIAASAQWVAANPERAQMLRRARRARIRSNPGSVGVGLKDWRKLVARYRNCCAYCGTLADVVHMDHVIPLALGGRHAIGNVLPACPECNNSKHAMLLAAWRRLRPAVAAA